MLASQWALPASSSVVFAAPARMVALPQAPCCSRKIQARLQWKMLQGKATEK